MAAGLSKVINFGICIRRLWPTHLALRYAKLADSLGYRQVWMNCSALSRDPFLTLGLIAKETSQINLGVAIVDPFTRHPAVIAGSAATLAEASGRKVDVALGSSHPEILATLGLQTEKPVQKVRDAVMKARRFLSQESLEYRGEVFRLESVARENVRVFVGASGPKMVEMAGEVAEGLVTVKVAPNYERDMVQWFEKGLQKSGKRKGDVGMVINANIAVGRNEKEVFEIFRPIAAEEVPHVTTSNEEISKTYLGIDRETALRIQAEPRLLSEDLASKVTTWGTVEDCIDQIRRLKNLGFGQVYSTYPVNPNEGGAERQIELREDLIRRVADHLF